MGKKLPFKKKRFSVLVKIFLYKKFKNLKGKICTSRIKTLRELTNKKRICNQSLYHFIFFTECYIKNMPLLGNFSDTCCIHCCYKNIVPPHFHNVVLTYVTLVLSNSQGLILSKS